MKIAVVICECEEPRTVEAAQTIVRNKIANVILLADEAKLKSMYPYADFSGIKIVDPLTVDVAVDNFTHHYSSKTLYFSLYLLYNQIISFIDLLKYTLNKCRHAV